MSSRIVITGVGCLTPHGRGPDTLYDQALAEVDVIREITTFDTASYKSNLAGEVPTGLVERSVSPRLRKKTDRFTHLALAAAQDALADAGLLVDQDVDGDRVGLSIGNILGGWDFAERELRALWTHGPRAVSPYQATAWFPTAAQGNISIQNSIRGPSRTFVVDRASSAYALIDAVNTLRRGDADVMLAGGAEAPVTPYGWLCLQTSGLGASHAPGSVRSVYRPYDYRHSGSTFGEGAGFVVLEREEFAASRGARVHGSILGWGRSTDGYMPYYTVEPSGHVYARAITAALERADIVPADLAVAYPHGSGVPMEDVTELRALKEALGAAINDVPVTVPKPHFGHLLGASFVIDVILTLWTLKNRYIPPTANLTELAPGLPDDINFARRRQSIQGDQGCGLVASRGLGGANACAVIQT